MDGVPADAVECALNRLLRDADTEGCDLGFFGGGVLPDTDLGVVVGAAERPLNKLLRDAETEGCGRGFLGGTVLAGALGA